ncbi:MAG: hypothetical protein QOD83_1410 [Solirubrobacteraceae bacterium]|jgi:L-ascorbate metabolism protein UlaG (beta-lactamase superfamily)|nr:hypothetical protein [Solirubrobacteraceae bacterium]
MPASARTITVGFLGVGSAIRTPYRKIGTLLDGRILVDAPPEAAYSLASIGSGPDDIDAVAVTHLHADHFFGLALLLTEFLAKARERPLQILGPSGIERASRGLLELAWPDVNTDVVLRAALATFVEWIPWHAVAVDESLITPIPVSHGPLQAFGLRIERGQHRVFHTGDTSLVPVVVDEVSAATLAVADVTSVAPRGNTHMSMEDLRVLRAAAPETPIMAVHRDFVGDQADEFVLFPQDGERFVHTPGELPVVY